MFIQRLALVALAMVTLGIVVLWLIHGDHVTHWLSFYLLRGPQLPSVARPEVWMWMLNAVLASATALWLAVRGNLAQAPIRRLAWGCAWLGLWPAIHYGLRLNLLDPEIIGPLVAFGLDAMTAVAIVLSLALLERVFEAFPQALTPVQIEDRIRRYEAEHRLKYDKVIADWPLDVMLWRLAVNPLVRRGGFILALGSGIAVAALVNLGELGDWTNLLLSLAWSLFLFSSVLLRLWQHASIQYKIGGPAERRQLRWLIVGGWFALAGLLFAVIAVEVSYQFFDAAHVDLIAMPCFPFVFLCFLVSILFSILYKGLFEPTLALGRGAIITLSGLLFSVIYVLLTELLESEFVAQFQIPGSVAALLSAALVSVAYNLLRLNVEPGVNDWLARRLIKDE